MCSNYLSIWYNEPIRADSLILQESENLILHTEFQTKTDESMPFRMLDYRVRSYRRNPTKTMEQIVIYLRPSTSILVYQDRFEMEKTTHQFRIVRLWEEPTDLFLQSPGLFPFAVLSQTQNPQDILCQVSQKIDKIEDRTVQRNLQSASFILAGLVLKPKTIQQIFRRETMKESATYQLILEEGIQEGLEKGRQQGLQQGLEQGLKVAQRKLVCKLLSMNIEVAQILKIAELSMSELEQIRQELQLEQNTEPNL